MNLLQRNTTVRELVRILEGHHAGEERHAERVAVYSVATGCKLGMTLTQARTLRYAAQLHDVGKVRVEPGLLSKIGALSDEDVWQLRAHAEFCEIMLAGFAFLRPCVPMIRHHHERFDGSGYPDGLVGESIPVESRILHLAEVFDTMTMPPEWAQGLDEDEAVDRILMGAGVDFDPMVVHAFLEVQPLIQPLG